ncbi:hypothetical protein TgHK011_000070 [Trichoderma gracile]|nr:hypothetical protein TgHK011_000070 [Trichoderma gracile]
MNILLTEQLVFLSHDSYPAHTTQTDAQHSPSDPRHSPSWWSGLLLNFSSKGPSPTHPSSNLVAGRAAPERPRSPRDGRMQLKPLSEATPRGSHSIHWHQLATNGQPAQSPLQGQAGARRPPWASVAGQMGMTPSIGGAWRAET